MKQKAGSCVLYVALAGMEISLLFVIVNMLGSLAGGGVLLALGLLPVYLASLGINAFLNRYNLKGRYIYILNVIAWLFLTQLLLKIYLFRDSGDAASWLLAVPRAFTYLPGAFRVELAAFLSTVLLWAAGFRLSRIKISYGVSVAEFQFGFIILLLSFFAYSRMGAGSGYTIPVGVVFIASGLLSISVAHADTAASWLHSRDRAYWMGLIIATILLVVILGLFVPFLLTPDVLRAALAPVRWLIQTVDRAGTAIAAYLYEHIDTHEIPSDIVVLPPGTAQEEPDVSNLFQLSNVVRSVLRLVMGLIWLGVFTVVIWRISSWLIGKLKKMDMGSGVEIEHISGGLKDDLLSLIKKIIDKLLGLIPFLRRRKNLTGNAEIDSIRGIYRELLSWAASRGLPRSPSQTPFEYFYTLKEALPAAENDLSFITGKYVDTRYGSVIPGSSEITEIKKSWEKLRASPLAKNTSGIPPVKPGNAGKSTDN